jgi:hypothetical protein
VSEFWVHVPGLSGYEISSLGVVRERGTIVEPDTYKNGDLRFVLDDGHTLFNGPAWKLMLISFYLGAMGGLEPEFRNGNRHDHSLDNLLFVGFDNDTGDWVERRWRPRGRFRKFDARLGRRIMVLETGEIFDSLDEVAESIGGQKQNVSACLRGRLGSHRGKTFTYV